MCRVGFVCFLLFAFLLAPSVSRSEERPNIVFLLADDQCTYSMGCYGTPDVQTPHLDKLARDGVIFDNHYDTTAICMASRANIMTGMFEYKTGCNFEHGPLLREHWQRSYPMRLRATGYRTGFAGKFGFVVADQPKSRGILPSSDFDSWGGGPGQTSYETRKNKSMAKYAEEYPHSTLSYAAFADDFIHQAKTDDRPFCLSISFKAPHRPVTPDPQFDHVYANKKFTKPANFGRRYGEHFSLQSRQGRQFERFDSWGYRNDYDRVMARYYQQIYAIDVAVGRIRASLESAGVAKNTVIIYTSDNGFFCGAHGYGSKVLPYEESSRVPLIMFDPRDTKSRRQTDNGDFSRSAALTGNVDFAPTILALAGLPIPQNMDGENLLPYYRDPKLSKKDRVLPLINVWGPKATHSLSVVTRDWKYIYWAYAEGEYEPAEELYCTRTDPLERTNRLLDPAAENQLAAMREQYDRAVEKWKSDAVAYHNYQRFGAFFSRTR